MLVRRIARPMLASIFVVMGVDVLRKPAGRGEAAAPLVHQGKAVLPAPVSTLIPSDPENAVRLNALVQIGGGLMLATGKYPRVASSVLAATLVPTTVVGHPFWSEPDPEARKMQQVQLLKNVSILGGLMLAAADTEGKPSLGWRGRRAAAEASAALAEVLPSHESTASVQERVESFAHSLGESASHVGERAAALADVAGERVSTLAERAVQRGSALADAASERGSALADVASERGSALADMASERGSALADMASERGSALAEAASEHGSALADAASERGSVLADAASEHGSALADRIAAEAPRLRRRARKNAKKARKRADQAAAIARAKAEELRSSIA